MKALVWEAPRLMSMRELNEPALTPDEVLIQVEFAGICGSELSGYLGHNALRVPPLIMGHEFAGKIVKIGAEVQTRFPQLFTGQLVTANPLVYDGTCEYCQRGLNQLCVNRRLIGAHRPGAYAEFVSAPAENIVPLPQGMAPRTGALTEPVACGVRIAELAGNVKGEDVLIAGAGPIGLLALQTLLAKGAKRVFISDLDNKRLEMGAALGGETIDPRAKDVVQTVRKATNGRGVHVAVDCVGATTTRSQCVQSVMSTGIVILSGLHEETGAIPAAEVIRREITLRGAFSYTPENFSDALGRLEREEIHLDPWIVEAPIEDGGKWFDKLIDAPGNVSKVLLVP